MSKVAHIDRREDLEEALTRFLGFTREGQLISLAIAGEVANEEGPAVASVFRLGASGNQWTLVGALEELKGRILHEGGCE